MNVLISLSLIQQLCFSAENVMLGHLFVINMFSCTMSNTMTNWVIGSFLFDWDRLNLTVCRCPSPGLICMYCSIYIKMEGDRDPLTWNDPDTG